MALDPKAMSSYLDLLPSIFSEGEFLGRFLLAFEHVLTGLNGGESEPKEGLEETIAAIWRLFDARETREEFLPWLAGWVALGLRADWTTAQKRDFLAKIVPLYRRRGTKDNVAELLRIYTGFTPVITGVEETEFQIGDHSQVGVDTQLGGPVPHRFHVTLTMPEADQPTRERQAKIIEALIALQKPAHTTYDTPEILSRTMQIRVRSTIGVDTLLGNVPVE